MNQTNLSLRLEKVGDYVPDGARLADIGSDHAYLPVALMLENKISYAVAGEVVTGPFQSAEKQVAVSGLTEGIQVRLANGLEAITEADKIDTITICGMGGTLIRDILERGKQHQKLTGNERLVLQPNVGEATLRRWLQENQYQIIAEDIIEENQKIYEIIVAEKVGNPITSTELELFFGPFLIKEQNEAFIKKWQRELKQREHVLDQLSQSSQTLTEKQEQIKTEIKNIREVLKLC